METVFKLILWFISLYFCNGTPHDVHPGITAKINNRGLDYIRDLSLGYVRETINELLDREISGTEPITYRLSNLELESLDLNKTTYDTSPVSQFSIFINDASATLGGDWEISMSLFGIFKFDGSGSFLASVRGLSISQTMEFITTPNGLPTISPVICTSSLESISIQFLDSSYAPLLNSLTSLGTDVVKKVLEDQICSDLHEYLLNGGDVLAQKLQLQVPLVLNTSIDLGLVRPIEISSDGITASMRGRCYPNKRREMTYYFFAPTSPPMTSTDQMIRISINQYVIDTFAYALHTCGKSHRTYTDSEITELFLFDASAKALSSVFPAFQPHTGNPLRYTVASTQEPETEFSNGALSIVATFELHVEAFNNVTYVDIVVVTMQLSGSLRISFRGRTFFGWITDLDIKVLNSRGLATEFMQLALNVIIPSTLLPRLNTILQRGYEIPETFYGIGVGNLSFEIKTDVVEFGGDLMSSTRI